MLGKTVLLTSLTLLLTGMLTFAFSIPPAKASGTIYIRADGSVDPPTAPISTVDNVTYTFTENIYDSIIVERDNIVVDGAAFTLQGPGVLSWKAGVKLSERSNVVIKNMAMRAFTFGIVLSNSSNIQIYGNNITNSRLGVNIFDLSNYNIISRNIITDIEESGIEVDNSTDNRIDANAISNALDGILLSFAANNMIVGNNITNNRDDGIWIWEFSNNTIIENNIANNKRGIELSFSSNNNITGNVLTNNLQGIDLFETSSNYIHRNNFINNVRQVYDNSWDSPYGINLSINVWDDGYPHGGNYWNDYTGDDLYNGSYQNETGSDGIGDTPYVIDNKNQDRYPLMDRYKTHGSHDVGISKVTPSKTVIGQGFLLKINVRIKNYGNYAESFNASIHYNSIHPIETKTVTLESDAVATVTFTWNTSSLAKGNYIISAYTTPVPDEIDTTDNTFTYGNVIVAMIGDITGPTLGVPDGKIDIRDVALVAKHFGHNVSPAPPNVDITGPTSGVPDNKVDIRDVAVVARNFGKIDP